MNMIRCILLAVISMSAPLSTVITLKANNNNLQLVGGFRISRNTSTFTYIDFKSVLVVHKTTKNLKQSDLQYKSATTAT